MLSSAESSSGSSSDLRCCSSSFRQGVKSKCERAGGAKPVKTGVWVTTRVLLFSADGFAKSREV